MIIRICDLCGVRITPENISRKIGIAQRINMTNEFGMDVEFDLCSDCSDKTTKIFTEMREENGMGL